MFIPRRDFVRHSAALLTLPLAPSLASQFWSGSSAPAIKRAPLRIDGDRLNAALAAFDPIGRTANGINRVGYSDADLAGRSFTIDLFKQAGLTPRIDAAGNIVARVVGTDNSRPPILIGSHVDSVTDGGNFDGPLGSFSAIEVARTLSEQRVRLRHPLDVVVWQNEEGGTIGSKLYIGELTDADLNQVSRSGVSLRDGLTKIGGNVSRLSEVVRKRGDVACYMELHIEQGGNLEEGGVQIGTVQGIVGLRWFEVTIKGFANHAGATPMNQRQDAMLAAARFTVAVNEAIRSVPGRQVATVGRVTVSPNTTNVIADQVVLTVDLRDLEQPVIERFTTRFSELGREIGAATDTTFSFKRLVDSEPALADAKVMDWIDASATSLGLSRQRMPSGAGHDAQEIARIAPMGMIFVPSVGGISHSPREFTKPEDCVHGANVLLNAVLAADEG